MFLALLATTCKTDAAAVKIFPCKQLPQKFKKVSTTGAQYIVKQGLTKCALPFGIIVAGDSKLNDSTVLATAKIVAELIDQNKDGNNLKILKILLLLMSTY